LIDPGLQVIPAAREQASVLANLLELYAHDFSEFHGLEIGEDGRFGYRSLPLYWLEPNRHPFLIRLDGKLAGLVLVNRPPGTSDSGAVWDMAEFFVLRGCRRCGIGTQVAHEIWRRFPGLWKVRVMESNIPAQHFWAGAISTFTGQPVDPANFETAGTRWTVFNFESV
jgi:predicted acetyltransferase